MDVDEALIRTFVDPARGERLARFLASPADRARLREELGHLRDLHPSYRQPLPPALHTPEELERLLRTLGAPDRCRLLSEDPELDGLELELRDALAWVLDSGMATFVSCIPGRLAYFEGKRPDDRYVLERSGSGPDGSAPQSD
jgi:hypothetical protein